MSGAVDAAIFMISATSAAATLFFTRAAFMVSGQRVELRLRDAHAGNQQAEWRSHGTSSRAGAP